MLEGLVRDDIPRDMIADLVVQADMIDQTPGQKLDVSAIRGHPGVPVRLQESVNKLPSSFTDTLVLDDLGGVGNPAGQEIAGLDAITRMRCSD